MWPNMHKMNSEHSKIEVNENERIRFFITNRHYWIPLSAKLIKNEYVGLPWFARVSAASWTKSNSTVFRWPLRSLCYSNSHRVRMAREYCAVPSPRTQEGCWLSVDNRQRDRRLIDWLFSIIGRDNLQHWYQVDCCWKQILLCSFDLLELAVSADFQSESDQSYIASSQLSLRPIFYHVKHKSRSKDTNKPRSRKKRLMTIAFYYCRII